MAPTPQTMPKVTMEKGRFGGDPSFRVQEIREPSMLGPELVIGMSIGTLLSFGLSHFFTGGLEAAATNIGFLSFLGPVAPFALGLGLPAVGALLGGLFNKMEMSFNRTHGREITAPTYANREAFRGGVSSMLFSQLPLMLVSGLSWVASSVGFLSGAAQFLGWAAGALSGIAIPIAIAGAAYGIFSGAKKGHARMEQEYNQASTLYAIQTGRVSPAHGRGPGLVPAVGMGAAVGVDGAVRGSDGADVGDGFTAYAWDQSMYHPAQNNPNADKNYYQEMVRPGRGQSSLREQTKKQTAARQGVAAHQRRQDWAENLSDARIRAALAQAQAERG